MDQNFSLTWNWLGFIRKQKAKDLLTRNFEVNIEYKILLTEKSKQEKSLHGGHNKEQILMTVDTIKKNVFKIWIN